MTAPPLAAALDEVLTGAAQDTGAHFAAIYLLAEDDRVLAMHAELGLPAQIVRPWTRIRVNAGIPVAAAVRRRELIWVPGHQELACRFPATALALPYPFATAAAPIQDDAVVWGAWVLVWPPSHPPRLAPGELAAIERATEKMAGLLQGVEPPPPPDEPRTLTAPGVAEPDASGCVDRFRDGALALDLRGRITFASGTAARLLGCAGADLRGKSLWEAAAWLRDPVFEDRCRAAAVSQQVTACTARSPEGRLLAFELHPDPSGISLRVAPADAEHHPRRRRCEMAGAPAEGGFVAGFLHTAAALTRAVSVREVVELIAEQVLPMWDVRAMAILSADSGKSRIIGSHGYGRDVLDRFDGLPLTSDTPAEETMRTGEAAFFADWNELRRRYPHLTRSDGMAAWAFLPLTVSESFVGACVLAFDRPRAFTAEDCGTLTMLAGLLAQTLDRALLYDVKDRLAHTLQTTLLPSRLPGVAGLEVAARYVPAARGVGVGGDFYDLIRVTDTAAAAVIGDVQGHNMTAAALMGQVRTAIRAHTVAGASPGEVLAHTNRLLIDLDTDLFTSCLLVHVDLRLRTLCVASAGHLPPLLRPPNAPADVVDVPAGLLLGIDPGIEYETLEAPFPPDALLALYTDGLVEIPGADLEEAVEGVAAQLTEAVDAPLGELGDALLGRAPRAGQGADDIALLLLQHRPAPAGQEWTM